MADTTTELQVIGKHFDALDYFFTPELKFRNFVSCGSSRSGKTMQISIYLILLALQQKETIIVARFEATTVRNSIWVDYMDAITMMDLGASEIIINKSEMTLTFPQTGARIKFTGLNDSSKMKGLKSTIVHIDEALDCNLEAINQLDQRCSGHMIYSYNPSLTQHYIMDVVRQLPNTVYLHSTYKDNRFIPQAIIDKLESYNPNIPINVENGTQNEYMYKVYCLGVPCGLQGCIFIKFKYDPHYQNPRFGNVMYGLDFGMIHPTALVKVTVFNDKYYCQTLLYESDLVVNSDDPDDDKTIIRRLEQLNIPKDAMIVCDCARPENITGLRRKGYNAFACKKGAGSVLERIEIVNSCQVIIPETDHLQIEAEQYIWKTDSTGRAVQPLKPRKTFDDALDAMGYAIVAIARNPVSDQSFTGISRGNQIINRRDIKARYGRSMNIRRN